MITIGLLHVGRPSERELSFTRVFAAPRELVYAALTQPSLLARWYGPHGWSLTECQVEPKPGGVFCYIIRRASGTELSQVGMFRALSPPDRIVHTETFPSQPAFGELWVTSTLVEARGQTTLTVTLLHATSKICEDNAHTASGVAESYDRLAELLPML